MVTKTLLALAWGLLNSGEPQQILIDHYTSGIIQGVQGEDIHLPKSAPRDRKPVIVAVLDTGVDTNHSALKNALSLPGYNAITGSSDIQDSHGHGTHISGIIAARPDETGFRGVSESALILPIKVVQTGPNAPIRPQDLSAGAGTALTENVAKGIEKAIERGAQVIHLSLAWPASIHSKRVDDAIARAAANQVIIVASAGNDSTLARVYPCVYESVICVGAQGPDGAFTHFSNHGPMVDLLAPGISILSTWPLNKAPVTFAGGIGHEFRNGTSMAAPFVSGAIAELLSRGLSPDEVRNRILLGTRKTKTETRFRSNTPQNFSALAKSNPKTARFGNLDIEGALSLAPRSFIHPKKKEELLLEWDGLNSDLDSQIDWVNDWIDAKAVTIRIGNQVTRISRFKSHSMISIPIHLSITPNTESSLVLKAEVQDDDGHHEAYDIPISLVRRVTVLHPPKEALVDEVEGLEADPTLIFRSVLNVPVGSAPRYGVLKSDPRGVSMRLMEQNRVGTERVIDGFTPDQLLNLYALSSGGYSAVFFKQEPKDPRPSFYFYTFDSNFSLLRKESLGTDTTVLSERFQWISVNGVPSPLWISLGFTPKEDLPPFDPWNPKDQDVKRPRVYFMDQGKLRTVLLKKTETPLTLLSQGRVLVTEGSDYLQTYSILHLNEGKVIERSPLSLPHYRMLIGATFGPAPERLDSRPPSGTVVTTSSSPGNLRVSLIESLSADSAPVFDRELIRPTPLDSFVSVLGAFQKGPDASFFIESHYDLYFDRGPEKPLLSTSLNRYSYIPSLIFARSFFPVGLHAQNKENLSALYVPATLANGNISEIIVADESAQSLTRPVRFRFTTDESCTTIGNLIPATETTPAYQSFFCGKNWIRVPLSP